MVQKDGTKVYQYQGRNGERITKSSHEKITTYEIANMLIVPRDGTPSYRATITVTMEDGEVKEYFWPTHEGNEKYGLRKKEFEEKVTGFSGFTYEGHFQYEGTQPVEDSDNEHYVYMIPERPERSGWRLKRCRVDGQVIETRGIYNEVGHEQDCEFIDNFGEWIDSVDEYLKTLVQVIDNETAQKKEDPYYQVIQQYNPDDVELEEGDVEGFVLYGVNYRQLCISMQRGGVTSKKLGENKLFKEKIDYRQLFHGSVQDQIYIEKHLEGGVSSRSYYYNFSNKSSDWKIGIGMSEMDPNAIIGFFGHDAGTSHEIKRLRVYMQQHQEISNIISEAEAGVHAELATLRNEYDITKIRERNSRR